MILPASPVWYAPLQTMHVLGGAAAEAHRLSRMLWQHACTGPDHMLREMQACEVQIMGSAALPASFSAAGTPIGQRVTGSLLGVIICQQLVL